MERLPNELLTIIVSLLVDPAPRERQRALLAVSRVSSRFRDIARPHLFRVMRIEYQAAKETNTFQDFCDFLDKDPYAFEHVSQHVQELIFDGVADRRFFSPDATMISVKLLRDILYHLPNLQSLGMRHMHITRTVGEQLECTRPSNIKKLLLRVIQVSEDDLLHVLSLFSRMQSLELFGAFQDETDPTEDHPPTSLPRIGHVLQHAVYPYTLFLESLADNIEQPIPSYAFVCTGLGHVRSVADFLVRRGDSVTRLSLDLRAISLDGRDDDEPNAGTPVDTVAALKSSFRECIALTHLHLCLPMSCECWQDSEADQAMFGTMMDVIRGIPPPTMRNLTIELVSARNAPHPGEHEHHLWTSVEKEGWKKLGEAYSWFEKIDSVELIDDGDQYRKGVVAHQSEAVRQRQEVFKVPLQPIRADTLEG
ncbi:hypothetical protein BDW22DRAFT_1360174 [Trametopsis cervina]|nr:hypothetical protein BDW22DRAFT_1360174 [Trametopsis cervina]